MSKYKVLAFMGESASGKTLLVNTLCKYNIKDFHKIVTCTTRPPREGEIDGVDYHFISPAVFAQKVYNYTMLEATFFNDWGYGTPVESLKEDIINIGVFNPSGIRALQDDPNIDLLTIYLDVPEKERIKRALDREENPDIDEIFRRYKADLQDFCDIDDISYVAMKNTDIFIYIVSALQRILDLEKPQWNVKI